MKLTVATTFDAPPNWSRDQPPVTMPKDDFLYRITDKGRAYLEHIRKTEGNGPDR